MYKIQRNGNIYYCIFNKYTNCTALRKVNLNSHKYIGFVEGNKIGDILNEIDNINERMVK